MRAKVKAVAEYPAVPDGDFLETDDPYVVLVNNAPVQLSSVKVWTIESIYSDGRGKHDEWTATDLPSNLAPGSCVEIEIRSGRLVSCRAA
jgi:hypothetical protein